MNACTQFIQSTIAINNTCTYIGTIEYFCGDLSMDFARSMSVGDFGAGRNGCGGTSGTVIFQNVDD